MAHNYCRNCGEIRDIGARFCARCGIEFVDEAPRSMPEAFPRSVDPRPEEIKRSRTRWLIGLSLLLVICVVISVLVGEDDRSDSERDLNRDLGRLSTITLRPTATSRSNATATIAGESGDETYPLLPDIRAIVDRPRDWNGESFRVSGEIEVLRVAPDGFVHEVGDRDAYEVQALIQISVMTPTGDGEMLVIGYDGDTTGMFEGTTVMVYGTLVDTATYGNSFGGEMTFPLILADRVEITGSPSVV